MNCHICSTTHIAAGTAIAASKSGADFVAAGTAVVIALRAEPGTATGTVTDGAASVTKLALQTALQLVAQATGTDNTETGTAYTIRYRYRHRTQSWR